jgi:hypothetical protein
MVSNTSRRPGLILALACAMAMGCASSLAFAASQAASSKSQVSNGAHKRPARVRFIDAPSSETPAARRQRLKRECKGRPNAGMCLGHAS